MLLDIQDGYSGNVFVDRNGKKRTAASSISFVDSKMNWLF